MKARCFLNGFLVKFERYLNQEYSRVMKEQYVEPLIEFTEIQKEEEYSEFLRDKGTIDTFSPEELKELERLDKVQESINWDKLRQEKEYLKLMADSRKYNKLKEYSVIWFFIIFFVVMASLEYI